MSNDAYEQFKKLIEQGQVKFPSPLEALLKPQPKPSPTFLSGASIITLSGHEIHLGNVEIIHKPCLQLKLPLTNELSQEQQMIAEAQAKTVTLAMLKAEHEKIMAIVNEHPMDEFDRRTANGEKLNLVTGHYYRGKL